jgi:putative Mg2+ transporter-C (MgtC) family protein
MIDFSTTLLRLVTATILGGLIGFEREKKGRSAGLRTHILVSVGSALVMLLSLFLFHKLPSNQEFDTAKIAAGVLTGIGFLGAGTIIKSEEGTRGLTTAASIWISSGIGLTVGAGYFSAALMATGLCLIVLCLLKKWEKE